MPDLRTVGEALGHLYDGASYVKVFVAFIFSGKQSKLHLVFDSSLNAMDDHRNCDVEIPN